MNSQNLVIKGFSTIFLILAVLVVNSQIDNLLYITTIGLGFFLFGYVERLLEEKNFKINEKHDKR